MNPTQSLSLTQKGVDEVKSRTYKLNMKKRSVLLLLVDRPQSIQYVLDKAIIPRNELVEEMNALISEGFVNLADLGVEQIPAARPSAPQSAPPPSSSGGLFIDEEIILSEARFLMVNFCVDVFGTNSQKIAEALGNCKTVGQFVVCAKQIFDITQAKYPEKLKELQGVIQEINQTAV